jgi:general secretion pathway protein I
MVALAIMAMALTLVSGIQQRSLMMTSRSKMISVATMLARYKMVDLEDDLFEEGFSDFEDTEKGDFGEQGFEQFRFELVIDKVELPTNVNSETMADTFGSFSGGDDDGGGSGPGSSVMAAQAQLMASQFEMFRNILERSIRRVHLKVLWREGREDKSVSVVAFFTDPRKIDEALGGGGKITDTNKSSGSSSTSGSTSNTKSGTGATKR